MNYGNDKHRIISSGGRESTQALRILLTFYLPCDEYKQATVYMGWG